MISNAHLDLKVGNKRCRCRGCSEYFNSPGAFDKHRTGKYTDRQCLSAQDMENIGMVINDAGFWICAESGFEWISKDKTESESKNTDVAFA